MDEQSRRLLEAFQANPGDTKAFQAASERLFFESQWDAYVKVTARRARALDDAMEAARLFAKAASIAEDKLKDLDTAEDLLREALKRRRDFRPALLGLREVLERREKFEALCDILDEEARLAPPMERPLLLLQAGKILESKVGDMRRAIETYRRVLDLKPLNVHAINALEKIYRVLSRWEDLRELLESLLSLDPQPDLQSRILFKLGKLYETRFSDLVRAARCLEMVRDLKPEAVSLYRDLARLYREQGNWRALVRVLEDEADLDLPDEEKARDLKTAGEILVEKLGDVEQAGRLFSKAAELAPDAGAETENPAEPTPVETVAEARRKIELAVDAAPDPGAKVQRILELMDHLLETGKAGEAGPWIETALAEAPEDPDLWQNLLRASADVGHEERAAKALEARAEAMSDPARAAELLIRLGDFVVETLEDRPRGIRAYQQALKRRPDDETAVARLETHWEAMGHREGLSSLYRWQASSGKDERTRTRARRKLTRVLVRDPETSEEARNLLASSLSENPRDEEILEEYARLLKDAQDPAALLEPLEKAVAKDPQAHGARKRLAEGLLKAGRPGEAADHLEILCDADPEDEELRPQLEEALDAAKDYDRRALLWTESLKTAGSFEEKLAGTLKLGELYRDKLQDIPMAVTTFEDALAIDPANEAAFDALEQVYLAGERWEDLVDLLERRAAFELGNRASAAIYARIGKIWAEQMEDLQPAASAFEKAATLEPENAGHLKELEETYAGLDDADGLIRTLSRLRETTADPGEAVRVLAKAGEISLARKDDPEQARTFFREVLDVRPDHVPALKGMQRACAALGDDAGRAEAMLDEAAVTEDPVSRAGLVREAGTLLVDADPVRAEQALREALALEPEDLEAAESLERIYENREDWGRLVDVGLIRLDRMEPGPERNAQGLKVASALETLGRLQEALTIFSSVLKDDPESVEAISGVRRIAEKTDSHEEAAEALRREIALAPPGQRPPLRKRLGTLLENNLSAFEEALEAYRAAEEEDPEGRPLTPDIERLLLKTGREEALVDALEALAASAEGEERALALARAGDVAARRLFDSDRAVRNLSAAMETSPALPGVRESLKTLLTRERRWSALLPLLEDEAGALEGEAGAGARLEIARIAERFTGDLEAASENYRRVLSREPGNRTALRGLARVLRKRKDWSGLADTLSAEFEHVEDDREAAALALETASLIENRLEDDEAAAAWYEKGLSLVPGHPAALSALERLYNARKDWKALVRVWEAVLRTKASDVRKKAVCVRLGRLYEEQFRQLNVALRCYKSALEFDPNCREALRGVQRVARTAGNMEACRKAFEKEIRLGGEPARLALLHQGVGILLMQEDKHTEALEHLEKASKLAPGNRDVLRDLIRLYEREDLSEELAKALERWAALAPTGMERAETLLSAARVCNDALHDVPRAVALLEKAEKADPSNAEVLQLLGNLLFARGDHQGVVDRLEREIELASDRETKSRLLLRAARLYEDPLKDPYKSAECLQEAVRLNPEGGKGFKALKDLQKRLGPEVGPEPPERSRVTKTLDEARKVVEDDPARAAALYMNVLDLDPLNQEALDGMIRVSTEEKKFRRAAIWLSMQVGGLEDEGQARDMKPSVFYRLGRIFEEHLDDPGRACRAYARAWRLAPGLADAPEGVLRLAPGASLWEEYVEVEGARAREDEPAERAPAYVELARIEEQELGRIHRAASWIRAALEEAPLSPEVLEAAVRVFEKAGDVSALAQARGKAFEVAAIQGNADPADAADVARLYLFEIHDPEKAIAWFAKALEGSSGDVGLIRHAREACLQAGMIRDAERLFLREIEQTEDAEKSAALHLERARVLSREFGDEGLALRSLKEAHALRPEDYEILSETEALARRCGRWPDVAEALVHMARLSGVDAEKADLFAKAGDVFWERLSDFQAARRMYEEALRRNPEHARAKERAAALELR